MNPRRSRLGPAQAIVLVLATVGLAPSARASPLGPLPASYSGVLPCADCSGIRYHVNLFPGGAYMLATSYFRDGKDETFYDVGSFRLAADSTVLVLDTQDPKAHQFAIGGDGTLSKLDREGSSIASGLSYDLRREPTFVPMEPRLMLRGAYLYWADAAVFTECRSGLRFPVAPGGAAADLDKAFLAEKTASQGNKGKRAKNAASRTRRSKGSSGEPQPLVVTLQGRIASRPPAGLEGDRPTLVVERYLASFPNESCAARGVTHPLVGTRWVLTRIQTELVHLSPGQREPFMALESNAGRVTGFGGCNRFSATYKLAKGGKLTLGPVASTKMACFANDFESPFFQALTAVRAHRIVDATLELLDARGAVVARFEARNL